MKKHKRKILFGIIAAAVLALAFFWGGNAPRMHSSNKDLKTVASQSESYEKSAKLPDNTESPEETSDKQNTSEERTVLKSKPDSEAQPSYEEKKEPESERTVNISGNTGTGNAEYSESRGMELSEDTGKDKYMTEPVPENKPVPEEPQNTEISDKELKCTLTVSCGSVFNNPEWLSPEKAELIPKDGIIFPKQTVTFYEGESVFNLLLREMKKNKIHLEFENTPIYNSAYIEGINNLYEFDCGELSGWMYKVNDWFPNYGCSRYMLQDGDNVEWLYTCDLGADIGGSNVSAGD